jgi:hypothetical protein
MAEQGLFSPDFLRRVSFMMEPLQGRRVLPDDPEERYLLLEAARDWLERFVKLVSQERERLLDRALNPALLPQDAELLHPTAAPIPGWDWQTEAQESEGPGLFDPEIIERAGYLVEQLKEDAAQPFFRELALLQVDRLDLLLSLIQGERARLDKIY